MDFMKSERKLGYVSDATGMFETVPKITAVEATVCLLGVLQTFVETNERQPEVNLAGFIAWHHICQHFGWASEQISDLVSRVLESSSERSP